VRAHERRSHFINGQRAEVKRARGDVFNPRTGERAAGRAGRPAAEVDRAVTARPARSPAGARAPLSRARVLFKFRELLERDGDEIARLITDEHGKVLSDAKGD